MNGAGERVTLASGEEMGRGGLPYLDWDRIYLERFRERGTFGAHLPATCRGLSLVEGCWQITCRRGDHQPSLAARILWPHGGKEHYHSETVQWNWTRGLHGGDQNGLLVPWNLTQSPGR